ncbi:hypothetical protein SD77_4406 [Bacillus badius]|uniref:Uncharacterized protein n=1 Tax=Bacillus badius TaxID=1455 RepID=A0ABR5AVE3_BACBA|nr:hypothetical protein SD78_0710 [Bacillus badius]KIL78726.1 hypothetical protein SD77_4406 [Bacillus badius]
MILNNKMDLSSSFPSAAAFTHPSKHFYGLLLDVCYINN